MASVDSCLIRLTNVALHDLFNKMIVVVLENGQFGKTADVRYSDI